MPSSDTPPTPEPERRHVFSVRTENRTGVLARVAGLFSARGFNIESLAVGETETPEVSCMTVVVKGPDKTLEQVRKQLGKLVDTLDVTILREEDRLERDLALVKLHVPPASRADVMRLAQLFHARVLDVGAASMILEITGTEEKINRFVALVQTLGPPADAVPVERMVERAVQSAMERLAAGLGRALDREVIVPTPGRHRPVGKQLSAQDDADAPPDRDPVSGRRPSGGGVRLLDMARTGRIALKKDPE